MADENNPALLDRVATGISSLEGMEKSADARPALLQAAAALQAKGLALEQRLRLTPEQPIGLPREELVMEKIWGAGDNLQTTLEPPSSTQLAAIDNAEKALAAYLVDLDRFYARDVEAFRKQIAAAGLELVPGVGVQ